VVLVGVVPPQLLFLGELVLVEQQASSLGLHAVRVARPL
jgi:hypothetical protein